MGDSLALVTGGGFGLGRDLARHLRVAGLEVLICGRRKEHLDAACAEIEGLHTTYRGAQEAVREFCDYVLASPAAMKFVKYAFIHMDVMGSDHCPIGIDVDPAIFG